MNDNNLKMQEYFNQTGGALYSTVGMLSIDPQDPDSNTLKLLWLVLCEAIARSKEPENILPWFHKQLNTIRILDLETAQYFDDFLKHHFNIFVPLFLFVQRETGEKLFQEINRIFPSSHEEDLALRKLLYTLFTNQPQDLFTNDYWRYELPNPEEYASPDMCAIAKLGQTLKYLIENGGDSEAEIYENWREVLGRKVLKILPKKINTGFAKNSPLFENLVFSLLHTSALLTQKNINDVREYIKDIQKISSDAITSDQLILIGSLFGLVDKYEKNSSWITDLEQRRLLSGQALSLSLSLDPSTKNNVPDNESIVFYSTRSGNLSDFSDPYLQVLRREHKLIEDFSKGKYQKVWKYHINVGGAFPITIVQEIESI